MKPYRWQALLGSLLVALTILFNVGLLSTAAILLSRAAFKPPILWLMTLIVGVRFFGIGRAILRYCERLINHAIAFKILGKLRAEIYALIEPLVPDPLEKDYDKGKLYNRLTTHVDILQFFYLRVVSLPLGTLFVGLVIASFIFMYSFKLGFVFSLLYSLLLFLLPVTLAKYIGGLGDRINRHKDKATLDFFDFYAGKIEYQLSGQTKKRQEEILDDFNNMGALLAKGEKAEFWADKSIQVFSHFAFLLVLYFGADEVSKQIYAPEFYPMLALMVLSAFEGLGGIPSGAKALDYSLSATKELKALSNYKPHLYGNETVAQEDLSLRFEGVGFSYTKESPFIKDLSFHFKKGSKIAFVGRSGSGKSTVSKLIMNLWQADFGERLIGETSYHKLSRESLWENIGLLEQKPYLFSSSIRENLKLANKNVTDDVLWQVLSSVGLKKTVENFEHGLDQVLGENGIGLSGGEGQRLALARLVLKNPPIVLLDEPYHSLDLGTKNEISAFISQWTQDKTVIMITHEFKDLESYDFIYVYNHGSITESGTHDELMNRDGEYRGLYELEKNRL